MSVGVMTVGVMSVGEITVGVMTVGVMTRPRHDYPRTVVSISWHFKNPTQRVGPVQSVPDHHLIEN